CERRYFRRRILQRRCRGASPFSFRLVIRRCDRMARSSCAISGDRTRHRYHPVFIQQLLGHGSQLPDDSQGWQHLQKVIGDVDFPPKKSVARGRGKMMVIVVPSFAERDHRERETVAAVVAGLETPAADYVSE